MPATGTKTGVSVLLSTSEMPSIFYRPLDQGQGTLVPLMNMARNGSRPTNPASPGCSAARALVAGHPLNL